MSPSYSDDLTEIIVERGDKFIVFRSDDAAEHYSDYVELVVFATREDAEHFVANPTRSL